jgi:FkbM family methyltransferase
MRKFFNPYFQGFLLFALFSFSILQGEEYPDGYEGVDHYKSSERIKLIQLFLPYNPVVVEAGAYSGTYAFQISKMWPQGKVFAFEPNPRAFAELQKAIVESGCANVNAYNLALNNYNGEATLYLCHGTGGNDPVFEFASSLLPPSKQMEIHYQGPKIDVPCVVLDDWCLENQIDHLDILKLELEGLELPVLKSSTQILKNTKIVIVQTYFSPLRIGMTHYANLKAFLEHSGFVLLSHWYRAGLGGDAIFLSREIWDAFFKKSMGVDWGS